MSRLIEVNFAATRSQVRELNEYGYHIIGNVKDNQYIARVTNPYQFNKALALVCKTKTR